MPKSQNLNHNMWRHHVSLQIGILAVVVLLVLSVYTSHDQFVMTSGVQEADAMENTEAQEQLSIVLDRVQAQGVVVVDLSNDTIIAERNATVPFPLASIAKVMTAIVALESADPDTVVTMSRQALDRIGDHGLSVGGRWSLETLVEFMLITSSNDVAYAINETVSSLIDSNWQGGVLNNSPFIQRMNETAEILGLEQTSFANASGLDLRPGRASAFGSPQDVVALLQYGLQKYPELFRTSAEETHVVYTLDGTPHEITNTNTILNHIPNSRASKTGYTATAGGNLVFVFEPEPTRAFAVVLLGSTFPARFADAERIITRVREAL